MAVDRPEPLARILQSSLLGHLEPRATCSGSHLVSLQACGRMFDPVGL